MTIKIQRGRQFVAPTAESAPLFDAQGKLGSWLPAASEKLVSLNVALKLKNGPTLKTADDWKTFVAENASTQAETAAFAKKFGVTFQDFVELIDDVAASGEGNLELDLSPSSSMSRALSLDSVDGNYAKRFTKAGQVNLTGDVKADVVLQAAITKDILSSEVKGETWQRDRTEQESWADFETSDGASKLFKDNTGVAPFEKLHEPKWNDEASRAITDRFFLPLHPELDADAEAKPDGSVTFQDKSEMFRETYYDDRGGALAKSGASVRARVRFDDKEPFTVRRVLVQAKEGRSVDEQGRSAVHKFEKRWENEAITEAEAQQYLVTGHGKDGKPLAVSQKLYELADQEKALPADGALRLEPKHTVLQKRRRTHLHLDSTTEVKKRRDGLKAEIEKLTAAGEKPDEKLTSFLDKVEKQLVFMEEASAVLKKYGSYMPSGEAFIVSADRYNVYDPAQRTTPPNDLDDELGRVGKGLHVEAEWDSASSDGFEKALDKIEEQLTSNPEKRAELEADRAKIESIRNVFREDVAATVEVMKERLVVAGLKLDPTKKSKDERAGEMMKDNPSSAVYWF